MGGKRRTLISYQNLAKIHGGKYILNTIPDTTHDNIKAWKCNENHIFESNFHSIQSGNWCSICSQKISKTLQDYIKLAKSKKGEYILNTIPKNINTPIKAWKCENNHIWKACYCNIYHNNSWCPYCTNKVILNIQDYINLAKSKNGTYILNNIPKNTHIPIEAWKCENNHIWKTSYRTICQGCWCPECAGNARKTIIDYKNEARKHNGEYILDEIPENTNTPINAWKCQNNHIWKASYASIKNTNTWCPHCITFKSEELVRNILEKELKIEFPKVRPKCLMFKKKRCLELDGYNEEYKLAFEYQGYQHYKFIPHFHSSKETFEYQQEKDKWKYEKCIETKISLMIIPYKFSHQNPDELKTYIKDQIVALGWRNKIKKITLFSLKEQFVKLQMQFETLSRLLNQQITQEDDV